MAIKAMNKTFTAVYDGTITADVYVGHEKVASPGDAVEVGDLARGRRTLCRLHGALYWVENSAWSVEIDAT